jgi:molybdopterin-guanine dinucleotide biosynthesis protein A
MPRFTPGEFAFLSAPLARAPGALAAVPRTPAGLEPLFACVRPGPVAAAFRAAWDAGERAVHAAFRTLDPDGLVEVDATDPAAWPGGPARLRSINRPGDLRSVLAEGDPGT